MNGDMKIERPLSSLKATNGLMSSYAPRPHKRKRKGLRLAVILLLAAVASLVAVDKAKANYICEYQDDITWQLGHDKDITMVPPDDEIIVLQWLPPNRVVVLSGEDEATKSVIEHMNWIRKRVVIGGRYQDIFLGQGSTVFGDGEVVVVPSIVMFDVAVGSHFLSRSTAITIGNVEDVFPALVSQSYCRRTQ